jgi:hypothetical protein
MAGYRRGHHSVAKLDDLYMNGLCVDDGHNRILIISFDLIGMDEAIIRRNRRSCAQLLGVPESHVLFSCTHTHSGPHTRSLNTEDSQLNLPYIEKLELAIQEEVTKLSTALFTDCKVGFYSALCDENRNRRYTTADNCASFLPYRLEMRPLAKGPVDQELGIIYFFDGQTRAPLYVIGNYAAHPLASHSIGLGGHRISADYPGHFRDTIAAECGIDSMFIAGAQGDVVPKEDEQGSDAARSMGVALGKAAISAMIEITRNPGRFHMNDATVGACMTHFTSPLRKKYYGNRDSMPLFYAGKREITLDLQCMAIGDVCLVGVPGELCTELGMEIKWHSPFRRTFIAYNATAYFSYICPGNFLVSGGYEGDHHRMSARGGLKLVNAAVDALYALREELIPSENGNYPDDLEQKLVNIPPNQ